MEPQIYTNVTNITILQIKKAMAVLTWNNSHVWIKHTDLCIRNISALFRNIYKRYSTQYYSVLTYDLAKILAY